MPREPFLINPPKRLKSRKSHISRMRESYLKRGVPFSYTWYHRKYGRKRKRNPVGETLVTIGANPMARNPWYGDPGGHRLAALMRWGEIPRGHVKSYRRRGRPRRKYKSVATHRRRYVHRSHGGAKRHYKRHVRRRIYLGYERPRMAYEYGHENPRRRRMARRRYRNTWFGQRRRHRTAALKGWRRRRHANPRRHRHYGLFDNAWLGDSTGHAKAARKGWRRRKHYRNNPRHHRRHYRRNPSMRELTSGILNVKEWAPLAITGGLSAITGAVVPGMIGIANPWAKYGVQIAVAFGGAVVLEGVLGRKHGEAWMIVGVSMIGYNLLKQYVLTPYFPQFAVGLGENNAYEHYYSQQEPYQQIGHEPGTGYNVQAFPGEVSAFPGEVSAYPYDGTYGY